GRLLELLHAESREVCEAVTAAAGLSPERVSAAMSGTIRLSLSEQLRLSEAAAVLAPDFTPHALKLRAQALSARSVYANETSDRLPLPVSDAWDRASELFG